MKRISMLLLFLSAIILATAQIEDEWLIDSTWLPQDIDIEEFSKKTESRLNNYRDSINARTIRALKGEWREFNMETPFVRESIPGPKKIPTSSKRDSDNVFDRKIQAVELQSESENFNTGKAAPMPDYSGSSVVANEVPINFYGTPMSMRTSTTALTSTIKLKDTSKKSIAEVVEALQKIKYESCVNDIYLRRIEYKLNDWATYNIVQSIVAKSIPNDNNLRTIATIYLLNDPVLAYNARIGVTPTNELFIMLQIEDKIFGHNYIEIDGKRYYAYMFGDKNHQITKFKTHIEELGMSKKHPISMRIPETPRIPYTAADKPVCIGGKSYANYRMNKNLLNFYNHYPEVEKRVYATAAVDSVFNKVVDEIIKPMVIDLSAKEAVEKLLHLVQGNLNTYKTDEDQFGTEKTFFLEENFYYQYSDCEDRAILFSYLVRKLVGLDVILLHYRRSNNVVGHMSTAVCFNDEPISGAYYTVNNRKFVVCDPTYLGASIGEIMPEYTNVTAEITLLKAIK